MGLDKTVFTLGVGRGGTESNLTKTEEVTDSSPQETRIKVGLNDGRDPPCIDEELLENTDDGRTAGILEPVDPLETGVEIDDEKAIFVATGASVAITISNINADFV